VATGTEFISLFPWKIRTKSRDTLRPLRPFVKKWDSMGFLLAAGLTRENSFSASSLTPPPREKKAVFPFINFGISLNDKGLSTPKNKIKKVIKSVDSF
jgi:hypothetical protein